MATATRALPVATRRDRGPGSAATRCRWWRGPLLVAVLMAVSPLDASIVPDGPAPDFESKLLDGGTLRLSSLRGRWVLVEFFASWCSPCVADMPRMVEIVGRYRDRGLAIVLVSLDRDRTALSEFIGLVGIRDPVCFDGLGWPTPAARAYQIESIPASYLVDPEGRLVAADLVGEGLEIALDEALVASAGAGSSVKDRVDRVRRRLEVWRRTMPPLFWGVAVLLVVAVLGRVVDLVRSHRRAGSHEYTVGMTRINAEVLALAAVLTLGFGLLFAPLVIWARAYGGEWWIPVVAGVGFVATTLFAGLCGMEVCQNGIAVAGGLVDWEEIASLSRKGAGGPLVLGLRRPRRLGLLARPALEVASSHADAVEEIARSRIPAPPPA